jgi:hypothetical protein
MYFTRFGYFVILSIVLVAALAIAALVSPFGFWGEDDAGGDGVTAQATATAAPSPTAEPGVPTLSFAQVVNFVTFGAVVSIEEGPNGIVVNLRPDFDVSGLGTDSHAFATTLPVGQPNVTAALQAEGIEVNTETGVTVIQR